MHFDLDNFTLCCFGGSQISGLCDSLFLDFLIPRFIDLPILRFLDFQIPRFLDSPITRFWSSRFPDFWISRFLDFWISWFPDFHMDGQAPSLVQWICRVRVVKLNSKRSWCSGAPSLHNTRQYRAISAHFIIWLGRGCDRNEKDPRVAPQVQPRREGPVFEYWIT